MGPEPLESFSDNSCCWGGNDEEEKTEPQVGSVEVWVGRESGI